MSSFETLRKYGGATVVVLSELVATGVAAKSYLEGNPLVARELIGLYAFATFYTGLPAGIAAHAVLSMFKGVESNKTAIPEILQSPLDFPQSPLDFPQTPPISQT